MKRTVTETTALDVQTQFIKNEMLFEDIANKRIVGLTLMPSGERNNCISGFTDQGFLSRDYFYKRQEDYDNDLFILGLSAEEPTQDDDETLEDAISNAMFFLDESHVEQIADAVRTYLRSKAEPIEGLFNIDDENDDLAIPLSKI